MNDQSSNVFFDNDHLTAEAIALYAEALAFVKVDMLPISIRDHVEECFDCKKEVFAVYEILKQNKSIQPSTIHPFFGKISPDK